jgi:hypothetical protein
MHARNRAGSATPVGAAGLGLYAEIHVAVKEQPSMRGRKRRERADDIKRLLENVTVVSDEEAEEVEMVICMPDIGPRYFADDVRATCAVCGIPIRHRPHVPKRPPKVCLACAQQLIEKEHA